MTDQDHGFSLHRRGAHRLAGRTVLQVVAALADPDHDRVALDVAAALAEVGARPLVAAPPGRLVSDLQARGGVWLDFPSGSTNPLAMVLATRRLQRLLAQEQVDLVHARSRPAGWMSYAATRAAKVPLATSLIAPVPKRSVLRQRYDSVMAKGDLVIAGSAFAAATIASLYPAAKGVTLIRPGVDLRPFAAATIDPARVQVLRHAWSVSPEERVVLLVARSTAWKGHKVLIEAVRQLIERGNADLKLVFVGGGGRSGFDREIEIAVKEAGLRQRAHRAASCPDMPAALLAASALVVPSIEPESFGRIAVEAQAVGTPVVVSDLGALPETVLAPPDVDAARRTGWRISPSDPNLLADALGEALALGASGRDALALRARRQAEERYSIARMAHETLEAYAAVLEQHAAA